MKTHVHLHMGIFVFSILRRNILVGLGKKTSRFNYFFFPLSLPTKHTLKILSLYFSLLNFSFPLKSLQTNIP